LDPSGDSPLRSRSATSDDLFSDDSSREGASQQIEASQVHFFPVLQTLGFSDFLFFHCNFKFHYTKDAT
jgi:hypothetical protein